MSKRNITAKLVGTTWLVAGALAFGALTPAIGASAFAQTGGTYTAAIPGGGSGTLTVSAIGTPVTPTSPAAAAPAPVYVGSFLSPRPVLNIVQPVTPSPDNRSPDAKWGDPINADLFDADGMHAKLDYYAGSGNGGTETGVGITFSFPN